LQKLTFISDISDVKWLQTGQEMERSIV